MSCTKQTLLCPLSANALRERNYMKYDKYGCRIPSGRNNDVNSIVARFD